MRDFIEINKDLVPYQFNILLADQWFEMYINHNKTADLFTVTIYKDNELICTEPLVLNVPLFCDVYQPVKFPAITITPHSTTERVITHENVGNSVFLTIDNEGDADE